LVEQGKKCAYYNFSLENGTVQITKYETDLRFESTKSKIYLIRKFLYSNNGIVISRGIVEGNNEEGLFNVYVFTPMVYSRTLYCFAGDMVTYLMCYSCTDCNTLGAENYGSK
jgi:hypothetical protein